MKTKVNRGAFGEGRRGSVFIGAVLSGFWPMESRTGPDTGQVIPELAHTRARFGPVRVVHIKHRRNEIGITLCY